MSERPATTWDPERYLQFADHRARPALDLLGRVPFERPRRVVDLGCGTGDLARRMAGRWPEAEVTGLDSSAEMLAEAGSVESTVRWVEDDIRSWVPETPPDLIYSNAALQWVTGHDTLFPALAGYLADGGCLAVQVPLSFDSPSHRLIREVLASGGAGGRALGTEALRAAAGRRWVDAPEGYYDLLAPVARRIDIWTTTYLQVLEGEDPVFDWVRGTGLRPVLEGLGDEERARFVEVYRAGLRERYPRRADGRTIYPFPRLFMVALT